MKITNRTLAAVIFASLTAVTLSGCNEEHSGLLGGDTDPEVPTNLAPEARDVAVSASLIDVNAVTLTMTGEYFDNEGDEAGEHEYRWFKNEELIEGANNYRYRVSTDDPSVLNSVYRGCVVPIAKTGEPRGDEQCADSQVDIDTPDGVIRPAATVDIELDTTEGPVIASEYQYEPNGSLAGEGESRFSWLIYNNGEDEFPKLQSCDTGEPCALELQPELVGKFVQSCVVPIDTLGVFGNIACDNAYVVLPDDIVSIELEQLATSPTVLVSSRDDIGVIADYGRQIFATAALKDGRQVDVTNFVEFSVSSNNDAEFHPEYIGVFRAYEPGLHEINAKLMAKDVVVAETESPFTLEGVLPADYVCATPTLTTPSGYQFHCPPNGESALEKIASSELIKDADYLFEPSQNGENSVGFSWEAANKYCLNVASGEGTRGIIVNAKPTENDSLYIDTPDNSVDSGVKMNGVQYTLEALELQQKLGALLSRVDRVQPNLELGSLFDSEYMLAWGIDWSFPLSAANNEIPLGFYTTEENLGLPPIVNANNLGYGTYTADTRSIGRFGNVLNDISPVLTISISWSRVNNFVLDPSQTPVFYTTPRGYFRGQKILGQPTEPNFLMSICVTPPQ